MTAKFVTICCLGLIAGLTLGNAVRAQNAPPPCGAWTNTEGIPIVLRISPNGDAHYRAGDMAVSGRWTWSPTTTGGILTIHYVQPGTGNIVRLYYSITPVDANRIVLSDPFFRVVMNRE